MTELRQLEQIAKELIDVFEIAIPPIPVENMLQEPREGMFESVDLAEMSTGFFVLDDMSEYSQRMYMVRLLVRQLARSQWGRQRNLHALLDNRDQLLSFARMIVMPVHMIDQLSEKSPTPEQLSVHFEVPPAEASKRIEELAQYDA